HLAGAALRWAASLRGCSAHPVAASYGREAPDLGGMGRHEERAKGALLPAVGGGTTAPEGRSRRAQGKSRRHRRNIRLEEGLTMPSDRERGIRAGVRRLMRLPLHGNHAATADAAEELH